MNIKLERLSDAELLSMLRQRDKLAFKYLYLNCTQAIKNYILKNGGTGSDAEEIEQNVIIHLYEKIVSGKFVLNENTKLSTYIFAVGKNMWYKVLGRKVYDFSEEYLDNYNSDEDILINLDPENDLEARVIDILKDMDSDCKEILTKYYYENKSMKEISIDLGTISEENVRKRKYKCIMKIRKILEGKLL